MKMLGVPCLTILNLMVLLCCMVTYMLRVNMAISIVVMPDMTLPKTSFNITSYNETCYDNSTSCSANLTEIADHYNTYTPWKQNVIQASFFWGYVVTEVPGGRMAEIIGPRRVIGCSVLLASVFTLFTPLVSAYTGYYGLVTIRLLEGLALGAILPSLLPLAARWVPPMDRGKFMSNVLAISLGTAITYPMCGLLIDSWGWPSVFYVTGTLSLLWTICWFLLVYDTPAQHPRISQDEKLELESVVASSKVFSVPWLKIITSGPVWAIIITHTVSFMNFSMVTLQMPSFIYQVHKIDIKKIGFYSSVPHLGKYGMGLITGYATSFLLKNHKLSLINTRRIFLLISMGLPGLLMLLQSFTGYAMTWTIFNLCLALTLGGAVAGGHLCGGLDIAPNFSGTIFGVANMLGSIASSLAISFVGLITTKAQTFEQWQIIFWLIGGAYIIGFINYTILGSATVQDWNIPKIKENEKQINSTTTPDPQTPL